MKFLKLFLAALLLLSVGFSQGDFPIREAKFWHDSIVWENFEVRATTDTTDTMRFYYANDTAFVYLVDDTDLLWINSALGIVGLSTFNAGIEIKNGASSAGFWDVYEDTDDGAHYTQFIVPALAGTIIFQFPNTDGDNGDVLTTDGGGVTSWTAFGGLEADPIFGAEEANIAKLDEAEVIGANYDNTANPWAANEIIAGVLLDTEEVKSVCIVVHESDDPVVVADGLVGFSVPASMNGWELTNVVASVYDQGVTATTDVQVRMRTGGANTDALSTKITLAAEFFATDEVVNTAADDVATGDMIFIDVDAIHSGTAPNGLSVVLEFMKP